MGAPLFDWLDRRATGVLLHPTSLPGDFGIGQFGEEACHLVDFLAEGGFSYWQICPLGPTGFGDSPYQCFSAFAGNPYLINLLELSDRGLLSQDKLGRLLFLPSDHVDYGKIHRWKWPLLFEAFENWKRKKNSLEKEYGSFPAFLKTHQHWLDDYGLFQALKDRFEGRAWFTWPEEARHIEKARKLLAKDPDLADRAQAHQFFQYVFFHQWKELRAYANERGIQIIGDIPIFVSRDSADLWSHPELFRLETKSMDPTFVAGCPPDYFSAQGQFWGNPVYDWENGGTALMDWWKERMRMNLEWFDVVRIDHFRGLESYWAIPFSAPDATHGEWVPGPGISFFKSLRKAFPEARIIAEDLGTITPEVRELLAETGLPGMAVLQFAFGGGSDNLYLPHHLIPNQVVYTGTHDNDTSRGWYQSADARTQDQFRRYFRVSGKEASWDLIRAAYRSVCRLAIIPMQDLMNLESPARLNSPGRAEGNWQWRYTHDDLERLRRASSPYLRELGDLYHRLPD